VERIRQGESHAKVRDAMALSIGVMGVSKERGPGFPRMLYTFPENGH
jgi:hypothetical protein